MELKQGRNVRCDFCAILLIVPYGIETLSTRQRIYLRFMLLIVPYGIETHSSNDSVISFNPFNRTLWN